MNWRFCPPLLIETQLRSCRFYEARIFLKIFRGLSAFSNPAAAGCRASARPGASDAAAGGDALRSLLPRRRGRTASCSGPGLFHNCPGQIPGDLDPPGILCKAAGQEFRIGHAGGSGPLASLTRRAAAHAYRPQAADARRRSPAVCAVRRQTPLAGRGSGQAGRRRG